MDKSLNWSSERSKKNNSSFSKSVISAKIQFESYHEISNVSHVGKKVILKNWVYQQYKYIFIGVSVYQIYQQTVNIYQGYYWSELNISRSIIKINKYSLVALDISLVIIILQYLWCLFDLRHCILCLHHWLVWALRNMCFQSSISCHCNFLPSPSLSDKSTIWWCPFSHFSFFVRG